MAVATISARIPLRCGCVLINTLNNAGTCDARQTARLFEQLPSSLGYWAVLRAQYHRCELVGPDNPSGFDREAHGRDRDAGSVLDHAVPHPKESP